MLSANPIPSPPQFNLIPSSHPLSQPTNPQPNQQRRDSLRKRNHGPPLPRPPRSPTPHHRPPHTSNPQTRPQNNRPNQTGPQNRPSRLLPPRPNRRVPPRRQHHLQPPRVGSLARPHALPLPPAQRPAQVGVPANTQPPPRAGAGAHRPAPHRRRHAPPDALQAPQAAVQPAEGGRRGDEEAARRGPHRVERGQALAEVRVLRGVCQDGRPRAAGAPRVAEGQDGQEDGAMGPHEGAGEGGQEAQS